MLKYSTYKSSGVECLGDIPEHWGVKRLKDFAKVENGRDYKDVEVDEGGFPVYGSGGEFRRSSEFIFDKPSVLLGRKGTIDKPLLVTKPFWTVDTMFYTDIKTNVNYRFFYYLCKTIEFDMYTYGSALPSMTQQTLHTINFSRPPLTEQTAIANYLDEKTNKLDLVINNKKEQIKRLKEIRQIEINTAVTKGLDPNVKLKASDIEWLGDIPQHWNLKRIKNLCRLSGEKVLDYSDFDFFVALENITSWTGKLIESDNTFEEGGVLFNSNSVLFGKLRPYLAKAYRPEKIGVCVSEILAINCESRLNRDFLFYRLLSDAFIDVINGSTFGAKMPRANWLFISSLKMPLPSFGEQVKIANYLDNKTSKIDQLVSNLENQINQLQEIRKIEIYNAVTGKIKVA